MKPDKENKITSVRLFSPMEGTLFARDGTMELDKDGADLTSYETVDYADYVLSWVFVSDCVREGIQRLEKHLNNELLQQSVVNLNQTVEAYGGQLWGVLEVEVQDGQLDEDMKLLISEWEKQATTGWGRQFAQSAIGVPDGELHVFFGKMGPDFSIQRESDIKDGMEPKIENSSLGIHMQ